MSAPDRTASWLVRRGEEPRLSLYVREIRSRAWLVAGCVAAALAAALVYSAVAPQTYKAEADLLVTPVAADDPNLVGLPLVRSSSDPTSDVLTVAKLVSSPAVAVRVERKLRLGITPRALLERVEATPVTQSSIIAVTTTARHPVRAAALANAFARATIAERTHQLHVQLQRMIPALRATMARVPRGDRTQLSQQLAVLETLRAGSDPTLRIASLAEVPTAAAWPRKGISLAVGALAGLVLALVAVFVIQALDSRLRSEEQLRELYDLPLLARVPPQRGSERPLAPAELTPAAEETFRMLRSAFTRGGPSGAGGRSIMVTGDGPGLGKTTVALNLAVALAAAGKQVIVLEADVRNPTVGLSLGVSAKYGITQVLRREIDLVDALIWSPAVGPGLELLLASHRDSDAIDLLSPVSARRLLAEAAAIADYVVIDTPPVTDISDALAFADEVDDVLVVARLGRSRLGKLADLGELLARRGVRPAGVVLVGAESNGAEGYHYYYARAAREREVAGRL